MHIFILAGRSFADILINVKPRPGHFPTSEEIDRNAPQGGGRIVGGTSRQTANQLDPYDFGSGHDTGADASYGNFITICYFLSKD